MKLNKLTRLKGKLSSNMMWISKNFMKNRYDVLTLKIRRSSCPAIVSKFAVNTWSWKWYAELGRGNLYEMILFQRVQNLPLVNKAMTPENVWNYKSYVYRILHSPLIQKTKVNLNSLLNVGRMKRKSLIFALRAEGTNHMPSLHEALDSASASSSFSIMIGEVVFSGCYRHGLWR